jgi:GDPmannose 4,6-dehydratase
MYLMLQQETAEDYVIATGEQHSVRDFVQRAGAEIGMRITFSGEGAEEKGHDEAGKLVVAVSPRYFRPSEVETLLGDPSKAKAQLGWEPKYSFEELVREMATEDLRAAELELATKMLAQEKS